MSHVRPLTWALTSPPVLKGDNEVNDVDLHRALVGWLTEALRVYLPPQVFGLLATPLLPETSDLDFALPFLCHDHEQSKASSIRFLETTALFRELGASLHRRLQSSHNHARPVAVVLRQSGHREGLPTEEVAVAALDVDCLPACLPGSSIQDPRDTHSGKILTLDPLDYRPMDLQEIDANATHRIAGDKDLQGLLRDHLSAVPNYKTALANLLGDCQVVVVLARALHTPDPARRIHLGSGGMTFVLHPCADIDQEQVLRFVALAQRVDALLGTVHFATASIARHKAMDESLSMLRHSMGNYTKMVAMEARAVAPHMTLVERALQGAVAYGRQEAMPVSPNNNPLPWKALGWRNESFGQTLRQVLWPDRTNLTLDVTGIDEWIVDSRALLMLEELARNLMKHTPFTSPFNATLSIEPDSALTACVKISGTAKTRDVERMSEHVRAFRKQQGQYAGLRGLQSILLLYDCLRTRTSHADFFLGVPTGRSGSDLHGTHQFILDLGITVHQPSKFPDENQSLDYTVEFHSLRLKIP